MREDELIRTLASDTTQYFPGYRIRGAQTPLPGGLTVDLHLKTETGQHLFVEVKRLRLSQRDAPRILDLYTAISNVEEVPQNFRLVIVSDEIHPHLRSALAGSKIDLVTLDELGLSPTQLRNTRPDQRGPGERLTPIESLLVARWEREKAKIITSDTVRDAIDASTSYANKLLHELSKKGWLERVKRGYYIYVSADHGYEERYPPLDPLLAGSTLVKPYYYAYATANEYHGLTPQTRLTVYIATTARKRTRRWRNNLFHHIYSPTP